MDITLETMKLRIKKKSGSTSISSPSSMNSVRNDYPPLAVVHLAIHQDVCLWPQHVTTLGHQSGHGSGVIPRWFKLIPDLPLLPQVDIFPMPYERVLLILGGILENI